MFQYVLANLIANNDHALGALFLDGSGETVDLACSDFSPYEMRVIGAYLGIYLRQLEKLVVGNDLGEPRMIHIEKNAIHIYVVPLPEGYHLALVQRQPAMVAQARATLADAVEQLKRELFTGLATARISLPSSWQPKDPKKNDILELAPETRLPEENRGGEGILDQTEARPLHDPYGDHRQGLLAVSGKVTLDERRLNTWKRS